MITTLRSVPGKPIGVNARNSVSDIRSTSVANVNWSVVNPVCILNSSPGRKLSPCKRRGVPPPPLGSDKLGLILIWLSDKVFEIIN